MSSAASLVTPEVQAQPDDRRWIVLVVVAIAQLMVVLDATIVNIALPSAQRALGFPNSDRQWVVTAYALAFGSLLLVGGRLGDMFNRKWVFITGLIGFALASAVGGAAGSFEVLVTARALQGVFGALLAPSALGTLVSTFQDPRERGRAFGVFGSVAAGGGGIGLILGGLLTQYLSWRYCLYVNLIFAAIAAAGALVYIHTGRPATRPGMDWPGTVLACSGLFLIVFGFSHAETSGWTSALTLACLILGPVLLAGFAAAERRSTHPLLPLRVILDRTRGGAYVSVFITGIAIFGTFLFLTYYLQLIKGESPLSTGLLFLPMIGCILITSNLSSIVLLPRVGPRILIATGMLLGTGGMAYLTQVSVSSSYVAGVLPALLILGLGFGLIFAPAINTATTGVRRADSGVASALVNTMQQVGGSIGTSALSTIALTATATYLAVHHASRLAPAVAATHGYVAAFTGSAALLGLGCIVAVVLVPGKQRLEELRQAGAAPAAAEPVAAGPAVGSSEPVPTSAGRSVARSGFEAIPVALCSCSPVVSHIGEPARTGPDPWAGRRVRPRYRLKREPTALDVLVVGAGPSGLFAAEELRRRGVQARIVEREPRPHTQARATTVQPGTLEILADAGVLDRVLAESVHLGFARLFDPHLRQTGEISFAVADCQWAFQCSLPQWRTERILTDRLTELGGQVERGVSVVSLRQRDDGVLAELQRADGTSETVEARWVIGAGGAHSVTRHSMAESLEGSSYPGTALVSEGAMSCALPRDGSALIAGTEGFVLLVPLPAERWLAVASDLDEDEARGLAGDRGAGMVSALIGRRVPGMVHVAEVGWASPFRMHRRLVPQLAERREFLLGDAGHLSSPFGGEGLNSGIHDGANLSWKLALELGGRSRPGLLASFAPERRAADQHVLDVSDQLHQLAYGAVESARTGVTAAPPTHAQTVAMVRSRSMLDVSYAGSPLVGQYPADTQTPASPAPGDRYPDRTALSGNEHHLLLFGAADDASVLRLRRRWQGLVQIDQTTADPRRAGLAAHGAVLVRPDGHIGFRAPADSAGLAALDAHLSTYLVPN